MTDTMKRATFTPGPWRREGHKVYAFGRGWIATLPLPQDGGTFDVEANARLIAAAPEMYEAVRAAYDFLDDRHEGDHAEAALMDKLARALDAVNGGN